MTKQPMTVDQLQAAVTAQRARWEQKRQYTADELLTVLHLVEEVGELATQYVNRKIRPERFSDQELDNAIADIFFQLVDLMDQRGIRMEKLIKDTIAEDEARL